MADEMMRRALGELPSVKARRELEELTGPKPAQLPAGGPRLLIAGPDGTIVQASEVGVVAGTGDATRLNDQECVELIASLRTIAATVREGRELAPQESHVVARAMQVALNAAKTTGEALKRGSAALADWLDENPAVKNIAIAALQAAARGAAQGAVCGYGHSHTTITQTAVHVGRGANASVVVNNGNISNSNIKL